MPGSHLCQCQAVASQYAPGHPHLLASAPSLHVNEDHAQERSKLRSPSGDRARSCQPFRRRVRVGSCSFGAMRGFNNTQGSFYHCHEMSDRNWVLKLVNNVDVGPTARTVCKNPAQRLDTGVIPTAYWFTPEAEAQLNAIGEDGRLPSSSTASGSSSGLGADATSSSDATDASAFSHLSPEQLNARLKAQLEYYFSRENLNQDRYLRSQMDADQYVPISTIAAFPKISQLSTDIDFITAVLKESPNIKVDETNSKVRAANRRCTLLLREIPEFTPDREVKAMFTNCPPYTSLTYGLNNSWYVTFATEEATQLAFLHLQNLRKSFNGKQICVRIKSGTAPVMEPDFGRFSPAKSETTGSGSAFTTIKTAKGVITGIPSGSTLVVNPTTKITNALGQELNLEQLMGPFGFTVRAIFQPTVATAPTAPPTDTHTLPELDTAEPSDGKPILGPPSTEIVNSLLSAAAEANETKKRELEHQRLNYKQIMDGMAPAPSLLGGQRVTDQPTINRPPAYRRLVSQESVDIEVAMDLQRQQAAARQQAAVASVAPAPALTPAPVKTVPENAATTSAPRHTPKVYAQSNTHQYGNTNGYNNASTASDNRYHGYSERSGPRTFVNSRAGERSERPDRRSFDSRPTRTDTSHQNYAGRPLTSNAPTSGPRHYSNSTNTSNTTGYSGYRNNDRRPPPTTSEHRPYNDRRQPQQRSYNGPVTSAPSSSWVPAPQHQQPQHTAAPLLQFSEPSPSVVKPPPPQAQPTRVEAVNHIPPPVVTIPVTVAPSLSSPSPSSSGTAALPTLPVITKAPPSSDTASTASSSRRKGNSESSEYNFVDCDFPSLIDKEKNEKPPKPREKAKFSAVVAGRKNDTPEEQQRKKSYASTLKKHSLPTSVPEVASI
uniref:HTH La-type RNA-binding domain-containing protein n=1 Tax=Panagrellus redivivus TaxID=6233 RepID=A0A7E4ZWR4_PANRE